MSESILGIQVGITSGCSIYYDGRIVYASSEERFTKVKNETCFPFLSIKNALSFLKRERIPRPSLGIVPSLNMDFCHFLMRREATFSIADYIKEQHEYYLPRIYQNKKVDYQEIFKHKFDKGLTDYFKEKNVKMDSKQDWLNTRMDMLKEAGGLNAVEFVNHEHSHAAYALYATYAPKEQTLVVTLDGFGDDANCSIWLWKEGRLECIKKYDNFNIGRLYRYITLCLGMKPNEHEYKVMGLAPYASDYIVNQTYSIFENTYFIDSEGNVAWKELPTDHYFYFKEKLEGHRFDAIAGALQKYTEKMIVDLITFWCKKTGKSHVALSGGVALNIKVNLHLAQIPEIEKLYVPASGGDESHAIGSIFAFLDRKGEGEKISPITHMYLGNEYSQEEIDREVKCFVDVHPIFAVKFQVSNKEVAKLLAQKKIIGRFCGKMEFGARSLGNRAILADPRDPAIIKQINSKIKNRDFWMPFTPSIIDYKSSDYLINSKELDLSFMTIASETTAQARSDIPATLHPADLTARPQIVTKKTNPAYYDLIDNFHSLTGVGSLLNTSLNLHGLPICESPADVFNVLLNSDLDMALLGDTLVYKK